MLLTVIRITSGTALVEPRLRIAKEKSDVDSWGLLFDKHVLGTVSSCPYSFGLKIPEATGLGELEVWGVLGDTSRDFVGDLVHLVLKLYALICQEPRDSFFEP